MEEPNQNDNEPTVTIETFSGSSLNYLKSAAPWMKFISILGFVMCGTLIIGAIAMLVGGNALSKLGGVEVGVSMFFVYLLIALVVLFPNLYLFNYAKSIQKYVVTNNYSQIVEAFRMQLKYWKYLGILIIIYLSLTVVVLIGFLIGSST
jgi:hypothetical protein